MSLSGTVRYTEGPWKRSRIRVIENDYALYRAKEVSASPSSNMVDQLPFWGKNWYSDRIPSNSGRLANFFFHIPLAAESHHLVTSQDGCRPLDSLLILGIVVELYNDNVQKAHYIAKRGTLPRNIRLFSENPRVQCRSYIYKLMSREALRTSKDTVIFTDTMSKLNGK